MNWMIRHIRGRIDLPNLVLLFIALLITLLVVFGFNELIRGVSYPPLIGCGFLGVLLSWRWLARNKKVWVVVLVLLLCGILFSFFFIKEVGIASLSVGKQLVRAVPELLEDQSEKNFEQLRQASIHFTFTLEVLFSEISEWWNDLLAGRAEYNQQVTILIWNYAVWLVAGWLGWAVRRNWNPFGVIIPILGLMTGIVAYSKAKSWILALLMVICFILVVFIQHFLREQQWGKQAISFSEDIRLDILGISLLISLALLILSITLPSISIRKLVNSVRDLFENEQTVDIAPAIGLYEQSKATNGGEPRREGVLPTSQLIGSPPELAENIVMQVRPDEDFLINATGFPYWRSHTFEEYTGRGWLVGEVVIEQFEPEERIAPENPDYAETYPIDFIIFENPKSRFYYTGELITVNKQFDAIYRVPLEQMDYFSGLIDYKSYQVGVAWPDHSSENLNSSSKNYPDWIEERYLQIPSGLPPRVIDLAKEIIKGTQTSYQQAVAIESYLRNFPYTLSVSPTPPGKDVVDYFLFDIQEGYCDYFATAMVVLARAVGLPARLVAGYASGTYHSEEGFFEVSQADAHSWVEIYFSDDGWVEFEPTSSRSLRDRKLESFEQSKKFSFPTRFSVFGKKFGPRVAYWLMGVVFFIGVVLTIDILRLRSSTSEEIVKVIYQGLIKFAKRSKVPFRQSLTPYEFGGIYQHSLQMFWQRSRIFHQFIPRNENRMGYLVNQCVLELYGENHLEQNAKREMIKEWIKLIPWLILSRIRSWSYDESFQEQVPE